MARPLKQLHNVQIECHNAPIICAGDIFDDGWRPNKCPPELINFALMNLPEMYAIPGQHDLPHHRLADIEKSAYWTMVQAKTVLNLRPEFPKNGYAYRVGDLYLYGFPWGTEIRPTPHYANGLHIAVVHKYIWASKNNCYPDAPKEDHYQQLTESLQGYDVAVFGDNHIHFTAQNNKIWNCGSLMNRTIDQRHNIPCVGVLYDDGSIEKHSLDASEDIWLESNRDDGQTPLLNADLTFMIEQMKELGADSEDFEKNVRKYLHLHKVDQKVQDIVISNLQ